MELTSNRWKQWMEPRYREIFERPSVEIIEPEPLNSGIIPQRPRYILWVRGGRALVDGEWLTHSDIEKHLVCDIDLMDDVYPNSFNLAVESPEMAIAIAKRITGCSMLGLVELENDNEYREWYDDEGRDIEELSEGKR
jgi:hypothetical protein